MKVKIDGFVSPPPRFISLEPIKDGKKRPVTNPEWMDGVGERMQATLEAAK